MEKQTQILTSLKIENISGYEGVFKDSKFLQELSARQMRLAALRGQLPQGLPLKGLNLYDEEMITYCS